LFLALNALSLCGLSVSMVALATSLKNSADQLTFFLLAVGLLFGVILLIPGIYLNGRIFLNLPGFHIHLPPVGVGILFIALTTFWVPILALGGAIASHPLAALVLPILNILAVGLPLIFFLRITLRNLELPPAQQAWSAFGVTLVTGPVIATILEGIALIVFVFIAGFYAVSSNPALAQQITHLAEMVQQANNPDTLVAIVAPMLFSPAGMLVIFGLFSIAVPAIEEAAKVMALWLFADRIKNPAQGFALGVLCGAAFALAENLGFSSTGAGEWMATAAQRAGSALPHMLNSGILGWALVSAWKERTHIRLGVAYLAVMLIHGLWNAISMALLLNSLIPYAQHPVPPIIANPAPLFTGWVVLMLGTFGGLIYCNRALRRSQSAQAEYNEPPTYLNSGENHGNSKISV
jgi:hypothetical protein